MNSKKNYCGQRTFLNLLLAMILACAGQALAEVRLPAVISDNMVLQQGLEVPIWGWAQPGEEITVSGSWQDSKWLTKADKNGKWTVRINSPKTAGPHEMTVSGKRKAALTGNPTPQIVLVRASIRGASSARTVCLSGAA